MGVSGTLSPCGPGSNGAGGAEGSVYSSSSSSSSIKVGKNGGSKVQRKRGLAPIKSHHPQSWWNKGK